MVSMTASFNLASNNIAGTLPTQFGNLVSMTQSVDFSGNAIAGSIPTEFGQLTNFTSGFSLRGNALTGTIPGAFGDIMDIPRSSFTLIHSTKETETHTQHRNPQIQNTILQGKPPTFFSPTPSKRNLNLDFLNYTEKHFNKRGRNIMKRIDKMRYVHDKPEPKYEPRVYTKPTETKPKKEPKKDLTKTNPNQLSLFNQPTESSEEGKLNSEIDKLESKWDEIHEKYLENKDPKLKEQLSDLDKVIEEKLAKLAQIENKNLPF